jgi:hypothetical protein
MVAAIAAVVGLAGFHELLTLCSLRRAQALVGPRSDAVRGLLGRARWAGPVVALWTAAVLAFLPADRLAGLPPSVPWFPFGCWCWGFTLWAAPVSVVLGGLGCPSIVMGALLWPTGRDAWWERAVSRARRDARASRMLAFALGGAALVWVSCLALAWVLFR